MPDDQTTTTNATPPAAGSSAEAAAAAAEQRKAAAAAARAAAAKVTVVMGGSATRPWRIGESIGLSADYQFVPGEPTEVAAGDAELLCSRAWDGRTFEKAS